MIESMELDKNFPVFLNTVVNKGIGIQSVIWYDGNVWIRIYGGTQKWTHKAE